MAANDSPDMSQERALLTERRREIFQGQFDDVSRLYEVRSKTRRIIQESLAEDIDILVEDDSDLYAELVKVVLTDEGIEKLREDHYEVFDSLAADIS